MAPWIQYGVVALVVGAAAAHVARRLLRAARSSGECGKGTCGCVDEAKLGTRRELVQLTAPPRGEVGASAARGSEGFSEPRLQRNGSHAPDAM